MNVCSSSKNACTTYYTILVKVCTMQILSKSVVSLYCDTVIKYAQIDHSYFPALRFVFRHFVKSTFCHALCHLSLFIESSDNCAEKRV